MYATYTLRDLLADYSYGAVTEASSVDETIRPLTLPVPRPNQVTIIGINGPTCAGKTSFSKLLVKWLSRSHPAIDLSFEWFLYERARRTKLIDAVTQHKVTIDGITSSAWDVQKYTEALQSLKHWNRISSPSRMQLHNLYNRETGKLDTDLDLTVPYGGYVVVEGVSVLDIKRTDLADFYIRLDVDNDDILIDRIIHREESKSINTRLPSQFLRNRYEKMDSPHMHYLRRISRDLNTYIINTTDFNHVKVYSNATLS